MAEIKTRIILRNDTAEAWGTDAGKATPLKAGEAAVELKDGKAKLKIATEDNQTFANAPYVGTEANVFQVELEATDLDDEAAINRVVGENEINPGDVAIVKAGIAGSAKSYTSYVYDGENWSAMDGNYSARNVYFKNNITLAGDYTSVGNIKLSEGTLSTAGQSLEDVMTNIFTKELKDELKTEDPSASISSFTQYYEIGTGGSKSVTLTLNDGEYKNGYSTDPTEPTEGQVVTTVLNDQTTGVVVDTSKTSPYSVTFNGSTKEAANATFTLDAPTKNEKTELTASGKIWHTQGGVPVSNLKKAYPDQRIAAGQVTSEASAKFRWYIPFYQGFTFSDNVIADPANITATQLTTGLTAPASKTADNKVTSTSTAVKNINANAYDKKKCIAAAASKSWRQYFLAYPTDYSYDMSAAKDSNGIDCTVNKANEVELDINGNKIKYTVYYINNAADYDTLGITWTLG